MIAFDYNSVLESAVGIHSLPESRLTAAAGSAQRAVEAIETAHREGRLGFAGLPIVEKPVGSSLLIFSQYMTAYAGEFYDIDAFDQPGVEYRN